LPADIIGPFCVSGSNAITHGENRITRRHISA
jgi:hypothetical protein